MSSHQLAIAKASFSASLLRPDPTSINRDDITQFQVLVQALSVKCSSTNIQNCKRWIFCNIGQSSSRFAALGRYLVALSSSYTTAEPQRTLPNREPSVNRRRLHLLYLINDVLHHAKFNNHDVSIASKSELLVLGLFSSAATATKNYPKHTRKLQELLNIWEDKQYYPKDYIGKLRNISRTSAEENRPTDFSDLGDEDTGSASVTKSSKNVPFVMPGSHGEQSYLWYDLPAGNLMPHIIPNSTRPINPTILRPLRFVAGPPDEELTAAVKQLLEEADTVFGFTQSEHQAEDCVRDVDELGQRILRDDLTNEIIQGHGYYGWSKLFCERVKRRRKGLGNSMKEQELGRRGRNRNRSRSHSSRRFSPSENSFSEDLSRSRSPEKERGSLHHHGRPFNPRARSQSRSRSPLYRSRSESPRGHLVTVNYMPTSHQDINYQQQPQQPLLQPTGQLTSAGFLISPPLAPQYQGQWAEPTPTIMPHNAGNQHGSGWRPPPIQSGHLAPGYQEWQQMQYDQQSVPMAWSTNSQQVGHSRGGYGGQGRGRGVNFQQPYQGRATAYNNGRGRGNTGGGWT